MNEQLQTPKVTLKSVADAVGVSAATVSNAYNRPSKLSATLREQILETARRLGYNGPDPVARGLRKQQTGAVAWILFESLAYAASDPVTLLFLQGMTEELSKANVGLLILPSPPRGGPAADGVRNAMVDGFIAYSLTGDDPALAAALERPVRTVLVEQPVLPDRPCVLVRSYDGARSAGKHLADLGHRRIGVLILRSSSIDKTEGPRTFTKLDDLRNDVTRERLHGCLDGLKSARVRITDLLFYQCESDVESGKRGAEWLMSQPNPPSAVLAMSDMIAMGAIEAVTSRGLTVPGDVSVVGFDDFPGAADFHPPLTTVHQPLREKGRVAAQLLLDPSAQSQTVVLSTELVVRASTGPARLGPSALAD